MDSIGVLVMRKIFAETVRGSSKTIDPDHASKIITAAVMAEREDCAKHLENAAERYLRLGNDQIAQGLVLQAAAIRERK